ncbi:MAG: class I SAM-dependent methyltransferase [Proteobacteria bacterium]|nr:class I SAM-dependent methyltransferase [Pseudomonadota bacterium]
MHQDTAEFANALYADSDEINYHEAYTADETDAYQSRVSDIYVPKVDFLLEVVGSEGKTANMEVLDIGSGAGHFVEALRSRNIPVRGLEISGNAVNYGNRMMGEDILCQVEYKELLDGISASKASVVTMIGVLEHLAEPREVLAVIKDNRDIRYLYLVLPVVSLAIFLEMFFQDSFNRVLGGGHTHLYSRKSLAHILDEFGFDSISEWWFGADIPDLIRFGQIELGRASASDYVKDLWEQKFRGICDKLQSVIDHEHFCSEIHIVAKKRSF